jgi:hypothetical protein
MLDRQITNHLISLPAQRHVSTPGKHVRVPAVHVPTMPGQHHWSNPASDRPMPTSKPVTREGVWAFPSRARLCGGMQFILLNRGPMAVNVQNAAKRTWR